MSTNIRVDVTLQRLQNQSRQATEQNRSERQQREEALQQPAALQADVTAPTNTREATGARKENPFDRRRPAAQRGDVSSITAVQYQYEYQQPQSAVRKLTVGVPGLTSKLTYTFNDFPVTTVNTNLQYPQPSGNLAALGIYNGTDPLTGIRTDYDFYNNEKLYDLSIPLCLPLNDKATIFVWDYHYAKHQLISRRELVRTTQSVFDRVDSYGRTIYDRLNDYTYSYSLDNDDFSVVRETVCFLVSSDSIRQLVTPPALVAALYDRRPTASKTGVTPIFNTTYFQALEDYRFGLVDFVVTKPQENTFQYVPGFEYEKWRPEYTGPGQNLAMQFGLGEILAEPHGYLGRNYFSGSVYQWLTETLNLSSIDAYQYSNVRAQLKNFPNRYISIAKGFGGEPPPTYQDGYATFGVAKIAPTNYYAAMQETDFTWISKYRIYKNDAPDYELAYCWNWDSEAYCRRKLLQLGFTTADLKP